MAARRRKIIYQRRPNASCQSENSVQVNKKAWNEIKPDLIQKSFKKCSISNSLDGTEDDYLFMEESNSNGENDTNFDDVPEDITEDEFADLFKLSNNESS
ncbi:hypothetical protein TNCV_3514551 [Trichonephila clavipes]|nr:hypothetical protein TNCV_3514551 [Trichonephila clavipes]